MEVILCQDVHAVGKMGDVIKVKDGFARNYLLPQKLAYMATAVNLKKLEQQKLKIAAQAETLKKEAEALAERLNKVSCSVTVEVNDLDKLYGSVTESEIAQALAEEGFTIDRKAILIQKPIEELGIFDVGVKLHPEVMAKVRVWVTKK